METRIVIAYALLALMALAVGLLIARAVRRQRRDRAIQRGSKRYND